MNKFDRITAILIHLQSKKLVRAKELSDRFEVSLRTIYRDIETLINAGVLIFGEVGVGYSIMEGLSLATNNVYPRGSNRVFNGRENSR